MEIWKLKRVNSCKHYLPVNFRSFRKRKGDEVLNSSLEMAQTRMASCSSNKLHVIPSGIGYHKAPRFGTQVEFDVDITVCNAIWVFSFWKSSYFTKFTSLLVIFKQRMGAIQLPSLLPVKVEEVGCNAWVCRMKLLYYGCYQNIRVDGFGWLFALG